MDLEKRLDQLRDLGLSEPEILDLIHQELARITKAQARQETGRLVTPTPAPEEAGDEGGATPSTVESVEGSDESAAQPGPSEEASSPDRQEIAMREPDRLPEDSRPSNAEPQESVVVTERARAAEQLITMTVRQQMQRFTGPMPPPVMAREYEDILPGFTERQLRIYEQDREAERNSLAAEDTRLARGQNFALTAALAVIAFGALVALLGHPVVAGTVVGGEVVALVSAFLYREHKRRPQALEAAPEDAEDAEADDS